jgi:hypothetical protein
MADDPRRREGDDVPADGPSTLAGGLRLVPPLAGSAKGVDAEGGDPVCLAHLICDECGAITTEGHRDWCSR